MPRRREADAEDMLARCPHCRGATVVADTTGASTGSKVPCPVCAGAGRVDQRVYLAYHAGTLDLSGTLASAAGHETSSAAASGTVPATS